MISKRAGKAKWDLTCAFTDADRKAGFITKERFVELLKADLQSGGYELTDIDFDFLDGALFTIKNLEGMYELVHGRKIPDRITIR